MKRNTCTIRYKNRPSNKGGDSLRHKIHCDVNYAAWFAPCVLKDTTIQRPMLKSIVA